MRGWVYGHDFGHDFGHDYGRVGVGVGVGVCLPSEVVLDVKRVQRVSRCVGDGCVGG